MFGKLGIAVALGAVVSAGSWTAKIDPNSDSDSQLRGMAKLETTDAGGATARVSLTGLKPNESLSWAIHSGTCGASGTMVGTEAAYSKLVAGAEGNADGTATFTGVTIADSGSYSVAIHRVMSDSTSTATKSTDTTATTTTSTTKQTGGVIACGLFKAGSDSTTR